MATSPTLSGAAILMTRVGVIGDVHGNWVAMEQVAEDLARQQVDVILGLGDYLNTSLGARPVVEWMKSRPSGFFVRGDNDDWTEFERFRQLERDDSYHLYEYVTQLDDRVVIQVEQVTVLGQHGYPWPPRGEMGDGKRVGRYLSRAHIESFVNLSHVDIACFGDIHQVHVDLHPDLAILHPGSVGVPSDGEPWGPRIPTRRWEPWTAKYLLMEIHGGAVRISLRRVPFSREAAVQEMRRGYRDDPGEDVWLARHLGLGRPADGSTADLERPWPGRTFWRWEKQRAT